MLFHSASMGEFEQAKPIIEYIKKNFPDYITVASFYSPSGYENQINYELADVKLYLPLDTKKNAKLFVDTVEPEIAIFIRYELWLNILNYLHKKSAKIILLNVTLPSTSIVRNVLLKPFYRMVYNKVNKIYSIDPNMINYLRNLNVSTQVSLLPDTRFDRVKSSILAKSNDFTWLKRAMLDRFILVAGSTWEADERILSKALSKIRETIYPKSKITVIYVPHEPTEKHIRKLKTVLKNYILFSKLVKFSDENTNLAKNFENNVDIIIDSIGLLLGIYSIADVAFVGGGFGVGIHSVVEPAGYGLPVACGPKLNNAKDALGLLEKGYLTVVKNELELIQWLKIFITGAINLKNLSSQIKNHFDSNCGATDKITKEIISLIN